MPTDAQRRANQKQDATRKRVALWLEQADARALARIQRKRRLPSRIAAFRWLIVHATPEMGVTNVSKSASDNDNVE